MPNMWKDACRGGGYERAHERVLGCSRKQEKEQRRKDEESVQETVDLLGSFHVEEKKTKPLKLNDRQMAACANRLLQEQKGSDTYDEMLNMFKCLGFNAKNMKKVVDSQKNAMENTSGSEFDPNNTYAEMNDNITGPSRSRATDSHRQDKVNTVPFSDNILYNETNTNEIDMKPQKKMKKIGSLTAKEEMKLNENKMAQSPPPQSGSAPPPSISYKSADVDNCYVMDEERQRLAANTPLPDDDDL
ncbi:hypothetical protein RFI_06302 [Reticulomyxa filosa]|uniref:Uncharacterized protein n=1 Tax=Reticulomyxa filosa TaxID=46433 RepID=X6NY67_RETFI|nr:hypothetical protein RFI_06302 [Reticulomyxa filosa]|eukprot:ETO30818.1 hypothetical protein RFI_06302 [Reticulomyxa filosa]